MDKSDLLALLADRGAWYELTEHPAVFTMAEVADIELPYPEADAKSLFVRDDKKRNYYLITVKGDKSVDLKQFRRDHGTRALSFASADDLLRLLGLLPGAVTPLGVLNDADKQVQVYLDEDFLASPGLIGVHPNENTATLWLTTADLISLLRDRGTAVHLVRLPDRLAAAPAGTEG